MLSAGWRVAVQAASGSQENIVSPIACSARASSVFRAGPKNSRAVSHAFRRGGSTSSARAGTSGGLLPRLLTTVILCYSIF